MRVYIKTLIIALAFFFPNSKINSQSLTKETLKKIDSLFESWNNKSSPGCSIGIVRNDSLIFSKSYGMANLEYQIPITPATIFYMASVSKQITGYCIVLLARQGRIKLDEDIHVYLPWVADFGKKITVRHLLNHTSGIRDDISLAAISGLGTNGMLTQDLALNILRRQHSLNFPPGEQYSYSNSNYVLLAEIIKGVSGKSFRAFADSSIFKPLGMSNTHFQDDHVELIKNRAFSYVRHDSSHYTNGFQNVYTLGDGGLFSNVTDMAKWVTNFYMTKAGDTNDINQLAEKGKLNNEKVINYALGIVVDKYKGRKIFSHAGALSGYGTFICVFPDLKMGFLVFSNVGDFNPLAKAFAIANLFINDTTKKNVAEAPNKMDASNAVLKDTINVKFSFNESTGKVANVFGTFSSDDEHLSKEYIPNTSQADQLQAYTGTYYCPELDCNYGIALKDQQLVLTSNKYNDTRLTLSGTDHLRSDFWWMNHLVVIRNNKKEITGFEVNSGRIMHLRFNKIE